MMVITFLCNDRNKVKRYGYSVLFLSEYVKNQNDILAVTFYVSKITRKSFSNTIIFCTLVLLFCHY